MRLSEMKQLLAQEAIPLTRSLGQNFMHDKNQLRRIVAAAELTQGDQVLEIGPGLGPLTELLLDQGGRVTAIEKDRRLVSLLRKRFANALELIQADALDILREQKRSWADWKLVSNLPYSCASPILVELAQACSPPSRMVATLQLEVARRLMAAPGNSDYGVLTLLVQATFEPGVWFRVPAGCFYPVPAVDSACITLHRRSERLVSNAALPTFTAVVKRAFAQRRKMIGKLLRQDWPVDPLQGALAAAGIDPSQRAEEVSPVQFATLTDTLLGNK